MSIESIGKAEAFLFIGFIFFLAIVIVSGIILHDINKSGCKSDSNIKNAHKFTAWLVGISSAAAGISLLIFIFILVA